MYSKLILTGIFGTIMAELMPNNHPGCIIINDNGNVCGLFGYINYGNDITINPGDPLNSFYIEYYDGNIEILDVYSDQPSIFKSGNNPGYYCAFFPDNIRHGDYAKIVWKLGDNEASINSNNKLCGNHVDWTFHPTLMPTINPSNTPTKYPTINPTYISRLISTKIPSNTPNDEDGQPNIDTNHDYDVNQE